jgi:trehalose 6-phosphate phosphatase
MIPLFTKTSLAVLESLSFTNTVYAFDFDGTLAPIVPKHAEARMPATTERLLKELSGLVDVAVISGRSLSDLKSRLGFQPRFLFGNHGLEYEGMDPSELEKSSRICSLWMEQLQQLHLPPDIEIENKSCSIAIHYRAAANPTEAVKIIQAAVAMLGTPPRIIVGKAVVNLLPPSSPGKGAALLKILDLAGARHAFYVGDDDTDEDIFGLAYSSGQMMTVRVENSRESRAQYYIGAQDEIDILLSQLLRFHRK